MRPATIVAVKRTLCAVASLCTLLALIPQGAEALDQGSMGTMDPKKTTHIRKDFPPIPGVYPQTGAQPFSFFRPAGCATFTYCNRHTFQITVPDGYLESFKGTDIVSYGVRVTLSWDNPEGNDVDLFVWPDDDPALGAPQGPCSAPADAECNGTELHPEIFSIVEPKPEDDEATEEDESKLPVEIYISVVNDTGVNTGYTMDLQWFLIPFGEFPDFVPPEAGEASRPRTVTASRTPAPFQEAGRDERPKADSPKILIPGPDGELVEQDLDFFEAGHRFQREDESSLPWVAIASIAISVLAVAAFVFFVWRRRRLEATL